MLLLDSERGVRAAQCGEIRRQRTSRGKHMMRAFPCAPLQIDEETNVFLTADLSKFYFFRSSLDVAASTVDPRVLVLSDREMPKRNCAMEQQQPKRCAFLQRTLLIELSL